MSRYIDADALLAKWVAECGNETHKGTCNGDCWDCQFPSAIDDLKNAPTVDAVPVVRCAKCKWWWKVNGLCTHPKHCHDNVCVHECGKDYFCADGERRTDETEGS